MRVAQPDRKSATLHFGCEIEHAEHLHAVRRDCILIMDDSDMAKTEGFNQCLHDLVMWDRAMRFGRQWCGHQRQFFADNRPAAIANERTCFAKPTSGPKATYP